MTLLPHKPHNTLSVKYGQLHLHIYPNKKQRWDGGFHKQAYFKLRFNPMAALKHPRFHYNHLFISFTISKYDDVKCDK